MNGEQEDMKTESKNEDPNASTMRGLIDRMTSRLAFRVGMMCGALLLAAVLFVFLFLFFGIRNGSTTSTTSTTDSDSTFVEDSGVLPDPYPEVTGEVVIREYDHVRGDRDADLLLVEYSDFECPFCQKFHDTAQELVDEGIDGKSVAWVYRHYPLDFHEDAQKAAEASECVAELAGNDGFWIFTDRYFEETKSNGTGLPREENWDALAREAGVTNLAAFNSCIDSGKYEDRVLADMEEGASYGVTGTPGNVVVDQATGAARLVEGAYPLDSFAEVAELLTLE